MLDLAVRKRFRDFELEVALSAGDELVVLFGPSGAGKSLIIQCIAGLIRPDEGHITVNGQPVLDTASGVDVPAQRRRVGYVPQGYGLFPHLTVSENIAYGLHGTTKRTAQERVADMVAAMRLQGLGDRRPEQLSGGQQQRVALARALIVEPAILLLDEPFAALDSPIRAKLRQDLLGQSRRFAGTTLFVTHDLAEAYMLGDHIAVLDHGRVLQVGVRNEVMYRPRTRTVARFTGTKNIFNGQVVAVDDTSVRVAVDGYDGLIVVAPTYDVAAGEAVELCIRPEDIMLLRPDRPEGSPVRENQLRGQIVGEIAQGPSCVLFFELCNRADRGGRDYDLEIHLPRHAYERLNLGSRHLWTVSLKKQAIHIIGKERL